MQLLYFGKLNEVFTTPVSIPTLPDTDALLQWLLQTYPALQQYTYCLAVNHTLINGNTPLTAGAVVALLPPFSGG